MKSLRSTVKILLLLCALPLLTSAASAATVTLSGNVLFSALDGSAQDSDGLANGVFTVNGDLVLDGTINCNDDPPLSGNAGACPIRISVSGDLSMRAGSGIFAENRRGGGAGGSILLTTGGSLFLRGPSGALPGAIVSSSRLTDGVESAGSITFSVPGDIVLEAGSVISASSLNGSAGAVGITADGTVVAAGLVASGPSRQVLGTKLTGKILDGGKSNQAGGAILIRSHSSTGPGIRVEGNGIIVSQGETPGSQFVLLEACGIEIRGLVASMLKRDGPSQVVLRSGKGLLVDGRDLGSSGPARGRVRADGVEGGSAGFMVDLFAEGDIQVLGPAASSLAAVSSSPGTQAQRSGGAITAISLTGNLSAAGNAFEAGRANTGNQGGSIDLEAKGNATLDGATLRAIGDFATSSPSRKGGSISVRSFQGTLSWTFGVGDVRPVGSGAPSSAQGTINLTACSGIDTTGTQFPTVGSALLPFPAENDGVCPPAGPTLPSGEQPLPVCNRPPVADGQSVMTDEDTAVTITLTGSDPDAQPLTFTIVTPPAHGSLGPLTSPTATSVQVTYTPNLNYNGPDSFTFQVEDSDGGTSTATVSLTVKPVNDAPEVDAATFTLNENSPNGTAVGTVTFTDPDLGQGHTFAITAGNTGGAFAIDATTGAITVANSAAVDFETTPSFSLTVQVTDDGSPALSGTATVTINLTNLNDPPVVNPATFAVAENSPNGTAVGTVTFTDTDAGQTHAFAITGGNTGGAFAIDASTGAITVANSAAVDFEASPTFSLTVQVTDNGSPAQSGTATVTINVTNINEPPVVNPATFSLDENSPNGTVVGTVTFTEPDAGQAHTFAITAGNTGGAFAIDATTGAITVANSAAVDFETTPTFSLTVQVTDNGSPVLSGSATVTINLNDLNDPPVVNPATFTVNEGSPNGTSVGTVTFTDTDAGQTHTFSILVGNTGGAFAIDPSTGAITVANSAVLDFETTPSFSLTVQVTDSGSPVQSGTATITINVNDVNEPPVVNPATFAVNENSPAGTVLGTVTFTDPDVGQSHTFAITAGNTGGAFAINATTGEITVAGSVNYELTPSFSLTVQVTDGGSPSLSGSATVTIGVNDLNEPPVAGADSYNALGNTQLRVAGAVGTGLLGTTAATGVLANDSDPDTNPAFHNLALTAASGTSAQGGDFTLAADGSFHYTPPAGFTGTDTFSYSLTDGTNTATGTVTVTVSNRVWYVRDVVDAQNAVGGDGRSTDAFDSLAALSAATTNNNDIIFIFRGNTGTTPLSGGVTLKDGQKLWGEGIGLTVSGFGTLVAAGSKPRIDNTGGDAVSVPATAGNRQGVEIRGLDLQGSGNAVDVTASGANNVGVTISDNDVRGAGLEGIDFNAGSTGAFTATLNNNAISATGNGFDARTSAAGTLTIDFSNNAVVSNATGVVIDGSGGGTTRITGFANNAVSQDTAGTGIAVTSATFDATPGGSYQQVSGGTTVIGASGNGVGGTGMVLSTVSGDLAFTDLDIYAGGAGLVIQGTGAFTGATGTRVTVTPASPDGVGTGTIDADNGAAVDITSATIDLRLDRLDSVTSGSGVNLSSVGGQFRAPSGSAISKTSGGGTAFSVASSSAAVNYGGTLNVTSGSGIGLSNNTGAVNFSGQLTLSTGTNPAFSATGSSGTVTVTHASSTLTTTTATALNVNGPDIGIGGLVFRSISANGAANGILLQDTGTTAGLTVSGTGSAGTGGTINSSTGAGIMLTNTGPINLSYMNVQNGGDDGIRGAGVNGLNLTNLSITSNGNAVGERGIDITQLTGSGSMANCTVSGSAEHNVNIANTSGTLSAFNVTNSAFTNTNMTTGDDGFLFENNGNGSMSVSITGSTFTDNKGDHFQVATSASATGSINVTFSNNTLTTTAANDPNVIGGGITLSPSGSADLTFTIDNNNIQQAFDEAISLNLGTASTAASSMIGTISNNIIGTAGDPDSGSESGTGISVISNGAGLTTVAITGNEVRQYANPYGILVNIKEGSTSMNATVTGNTVANPGTFAINGVRVDAGATTGDSGTLCAAVTGNSVAGSGPGADTDIRLRQRFNTTIKLPGYGGSNSDTTAVNSFVAGNNAGSDVSSAQNVAGGGGGFIGGAACPTP